MSTIFGLGLLTASALKATTSVMQIAGPIAAFAIGAAVHPIKTFESSRATSRQRSSEHEALLRLDAMSDAELRDIGLKRGDLGAVLDVNDPTGALNQIIESRYGLRR